MAIIAWIFGGLITLTGGLTIAEIGTQMLYTGGLYVYIENLYGRICGFMAGWMQIIVYGPAIIASVAGFMSILMANFYRNGWFPNGFSGVFTTMLTVNFAFSGTELIGVLQVKQKILKRLFLVQSRQRFGGCLFSSLVVLL